MSDLVLTFEELLTSLRDSIQQLANSDEVDEIDYDIIEAGYEELCDMMESLMEEEEAHFTLEEFILDNLPKIDIVEKLFCSSILSA